MKKLFKWWEILIIVLFFGGLITLGALKDLEIAELVYNPNNSFATICNLFGYMPSPIFAASGVMMLVLAPNPKKKFYSFVRILAIAGGTIFAYYYIMDNLYEDFGSFWFCALGALIVATSMFITYLISRNADKELLARVGLLIVFVIGAETAIIIVAKMLLARPRYRFVLANGTDCFRNFWQFDSALKTKYIDLGVASEEFESFPSGHATASMTLALLFTLPFITNKGKFMTRINFVIGILFSLAVSYGRMMAGAHYLSDVGFGMFITMVCIIVCYYIFLYRYKK